MKRTTYYTIGSVSGGLAACAVVSLYQDSMGKLAYSRHVLDHWASETYTVPAAVAVLLCVVVVAVFAGFQAAVDSVDDGS